MRWFRRTPKAEARQDNKAKEALVAKSIADEFARGELKHRTLSSHGISRMAVIWRGVYVEVSWYSSGGLHEFSAGGKQSINREHIEIILNAAKDRADRIAQEDLANLYDRL